MARVQRLFFLNEGQGLSNFLTLDLGFLKYPSFKVKRTRQVFPSRAKLLEYENALVEAAALDDALEVIVSNAIKRAKICIKSQTIWS